MELSQKDCQIVDEHLDSVGGRVAGNGVNRSKVCELVKEATFTSLWDRIKAKSPLDRRPLLDELTRMATRLPGIKYPLPDAITRELIANAPDETVAFDLYHTISMWIRCGGGDGTASRLADLFDRLPRGLQLIYTLTKLESDTHNGGISMAISRWADARPDIDRFPTETYHDCRLVGAVKKAELHKKAMLLTKRMCAELKELAAHDEDQRADLESECEAKFDRKFYRLSQAYWALLEAEGLYELMIRYLRQHPDKFICGNGYKNRRKCRRI